MFRCYDRNGIQITEKEAKYLRRDPDYRYVAKTTITEAQDVDISYHVSTVWTGINLSIEDGPPLIFETMVFGGSGSDEDQNDVDEHEVERYATLAEAQQGHRRYVVTAASWLLDPIVLGPDD